MGKSGSMHAAGWSACVIAALLATACEPAVVVQLAPNGLSGFDQIHAGGLPGRDCPRAGEDMDVVLDAARQRLLLFGGKGDDDVNINELWAFGLQARTWTPVVTQGAQPPAREDHTLVLDEANDSLVLFGGEDGKTSRETWSLDLRTGVWEDITHDSAPKREDHIATYDPKAQRMLVFGGQDGSDVHNETWALDLRLESPGYHTWSQVATTGELPRPRREHAGEYDSVHHQLLVFGGRTRSKDGFLNDLWSLSLDDDHWHKVETSGVPPDPVRQMVMGFDPDANQLTIFGGEVCVHIESEGDDEEMLDDRIWVLDLADGRWEDRTPYPRAMYDHAGLFVPALGGLWIYGGSTNHPTKAHASWLVHDLQPVDAPPRAAPPH